MHKPRASKFAGLIKAINGPEKASSATNEHSETFRIHTASQSLAEVILPPDCSLGVSAGDILSIQLEQPADTMLVQVSSHSFDSTVTTKCQLSILKSIVDMFQISFEEGHRFRAKIKKVPHENYSKYHVDFVEVVVKDQCVSEYDRYRLTKCLVDNVIYPLKTLEFQKVRVNIFNLFANGDIPKMGILTSSSKVIYRSGSSTHTILIEFTKDMFDLDYYQQMYVERVVELLKVYNLRNNIFQTNHNIEIVLFARLFYPQFKTLNQAYDLMVGEVEKLHSQETSNINSINLAVAFQKDARDRIYEDCYRKIIWCQHYGSLTAFVWKKIGEFLYTINWKQNIKPLAVKILQRLQTEMGKTQEISNNSIYGLGDPDLKIRPFIHFLQCELSDSDSCNILEAIILAADQQGKNYYGTSMSTTGNAITVLSAGHSRYYTDPATYRLAKSTVYLTNISCILINLRQKKPQLEIIQIKGPSNLVQENSDSKMNLLIYGCLDALIYSSPLHGEPYQHPHCFQNRMAIKMRHLKEINTANQHLYFQNIKLSKLQCSHETHFVVEEMPDQSSSTSYEEKVKIPHWINYCYMGKKALRLHNKFYEVKEGMDPARQYLYGQTTKEVEVLPIYRHADEELFEATSLKSKEHEEAKKQQPYLCFGNIEELGLKLKQKVIQEAIFSNQVCSKVYLSRCFQKKRSDPMGLLAAATKSVFFKEESLVLKKKESKKRVLSHLQLRMRTSSIFQEDRFEIADMEPCMFFTNFIRSASSQFKLRNRHNFIDLKIHYLMPYFSDNAVKSLKITVFRDNAEFNRTHRQFDLEWNWKHLCFPLLTPITTVSDIESLRIIQRENIISPDAEKVKALVGQKLCEGFQLVSDPEKVVSSFSPRPLVYHLMKGHLYYPIAVLDESNLSLRECQVIDKNAKISQQNPNNEDLIKSIEHKYSDMLYRYLCYEEKEFRFVPKRTYFKNDNTWHKIKSFNQQAMKISLIIDTSSEKTLDREKYRHNCRQNFKEFINGLNKMFKDRIPGFGIEVSEGLITDLPSIVCVPIKIRHLNPHLEIFKNDEFVLSYESVWNSRCTFNITLEWNGCISIYINEFLSSIMSMARFGRKITPCLVPSSPCIFETEWKFESPAEIVFQHQISMDLMTTTMEEEWAWDRNGFFFHKDGFSFVKFFKDKKLLLWKDNYKQIVQAKEVPESQFFKFFIKACVYDIVGEILERMFKG